MIAEDCIQRQKKKEHVKAVNTRLRAFACCRRHDVTRAFGDNIAPNIQEKKQNVVNSYNPKMKSTMASFPSYRAKSRAV